MVNNFHPGKNCWEPFKECCTEKLHFDSRMNFKFTVGHGTHRQCPLPLPGPLPFLLIWHFGHQQSCWHSLQPRGWGIHQGLGHFSSHTSTEVRGWWDPWANKALTCRAEQGMHALVPSNWGAEESKPHNAQKLSQKEKFLRKLFPFWDELICFSCLVYANSIGCYAAWSETVMHGC